MDDIGLALVGTEEEHGRIRARAGANLWDLGGRVPWAVPGHRIRSHPALDSPIRPIPSYLALPPRVIFLKGRPYHIYCHEG